MIKYSKLPENIESLIPGAVAYLSSMDEVRFAYLFGGLAGGKPTPLSDVDIAVYLLEDTNLLEKKMEILGKMIELLETDVIDLILLNKAPLSLRKKILESRRVIVDNDPFLRHKYESLTLREYFDFSVKEMAILERRFLHG